MNDENSAYCWGRNMPAEQFPQNVQYLKLQAEFGDCWKFEEKYLFLEQKILLLIFPYF